jgi:CHAT domain-containing protein
LPKLDALRHAQLAMIKVYRLHPPKESVSRPEEQPGAVAAAETGLLPPVYWAAFVLSGDWR